MLKSRESISKLTIPRMVIYYNTLKKLQDEDARVCSSNQLSQRTGVSPSVIRRDLASFGGFGTKGVGYEVDFLLRWIEEILGYTAEWKVVLAGIENCQAGFANLQAMLPPGFKITAVVDFNKPAYSIPRLTLPVQPISKLTAIIKEQGITIGLVNVLPKQAQKVVDQMVKARIKGIANFSEVPVVVPDNISLSQMSMTSCLSQLSYTLSNGKAACRAKKII